MGSRHYEATQLALLASSLQETKGQASRVLGERVRVAKGGLGFYKGVEKVGYTVHVYIGNIAW